MQRIGTALGDDVHIAAQSPSELGLPAGCHHLKLLHYIQPVKKAAEARCIVICGNAVHDKTVGEVALAAHGKALAGHGGGFGKELIAGRVGWRNAWNEQCDIQEVAPVEWQILDLSQRYRPGHLCTGGFEHRGFTRNRDICFGDDRQSDGQLEGRANSQRERTYRVPKSWLLHLDLIWPEAEIREPKPSVSVRDRCTRQVRRRLSCGDLRPLNYGARRVCYPSAHASVIDRLLR